MRAPWAWVLVILVGCSFESAGLPTIENSCANDASCPVGVCEGNICIDDSGAAVAIAIEVLRAPSDMQGVTPESWTFAPESFSGSSIRDLTLPATRQVRGVVRWDDLRVPATLRFIRRMPDTVAPLQPVAVEVETLPEAAGGDGPESYDFRAALVAGETYDVVVLPSSDMVMAPTQEASAPAIRSLPPLYLELEVEEGDPREPLRFDIAFPPSLGDDCIEDGDTVCTLEADVCSVDRETVLPEAGLQVRAIDRTTARVVSSIAETDENGHFVIRIGDTASDYLIRVTSSVGGEPFAAVSVDPNDPELAFWDEKRICIPRLPSVQSSGRVSDVDDSPVPGATVRFLSTGIFDESLLGLEGSFSASATTSEDGSFGVELLPGLYSITVTPPEDVDNTWGVLSASTLVGGELTTIETLIVPSQFDLRGSVITFDDESAPGVSILARARQDKDLGAVQRSQEAVTDVLGAFEMSVDAGRYDVQVKVSSETGFAWLVEPELVMSDERGDMTRDYRLDPPIPVQGVIRSSNGEIVSDAQIRAYVLTSAEGSATRPLQVADTTSGEDGSYRLLIAPRLGDE